MKLIKDILPQIYMEIKERLNTPRTTKDKYMIVEDMKWLLQQRSLPKIIPVEERRYHLSYMAMIDSIAHSVGQKALIKTLETNEAGIQDDIVDEYLEKETKVLDRLYKERGESPDYIAPHYVPRCIPNWLRRRPLKAVDPKKKDEHQQQCRFASHMFDTLHAQYQNRTTRRHGMPTHFPNATHAYPLP